VPIDILMPASGADTVEATIARWTRAPGAAVRKGEVLVEVETDKAIVEVTAPEDGVLARIDAPDGAERVRVGAVIGVIALAGEDPAKAGAASPGRATGTARPSAPPAGAAPIAAATATSVETAASQASGRVAASPLARRIARKLGVDVADVRGSGPRGRVVRIDVERAAAARPPAEPGRAAPRSRPEPERVPHTGMRRAIAQRLAASKQTVPHFYLTIDCDVDALVALRADLEKQAGFKPTLNDVCVKAAALALKAVPAVNASWTDEAVLRHRNVDVSVAVATSGGLVTPVVRDADRKSLREIADEVRELAARAKEGRLRTHEIEGGSFTVTNLGRYGVREFQAIVNPPQACILAIGASEPRAVVRGGAVVVATRMSATLSADHRIVDGVVGAEFLSAWRRLVESPLALLV